MAQMFDTERLELRGQPFLVEGEIGRSSAGSGAYSLSSAGTLAYAGALSESGRLTWFDRVGNAFGSVGSFGDWTDFRLSPDEMRLAASLVKPKTGFPDVWLTDMTRGNSAPFTFGPALNAAPIWSPDGSRILFRSTRTGGMTEFYAKSAGGGGKDAPVLLQSAMRSFPGALSAVTFPTDWSPDGKYLLFTANVSGDEDLWVLPLERDAKPTSFVTPPGDQWHGNFSPDGHLVAYTSSESGRLKSRFTHSHSLVDNGQSPPMAGTNLAGGLMAVKSTISPRTRSSWPCQLVEGLPLAPLSRSFRHVSAGCRARSARITFRAATASDS